MEQQQHHHQQPLPQALYVQQPHHVSPKSMWVTKIIFRIIQIVFDLVIIGLTARFSIVEGRALPLLLFILPAGVSFIWAVAEAIAIVVRGGHRGIHPGACVGVDLVLWLGITAVTVIFGLTGYLWYGSYDDYYWSYDNYHDDPAIQEAVRLAQASWAFVILLDIAHFVSFILACCETGQRNAQPSIVYYNPGPGPFPMAAAAAGPPPPPGGHYSIIMSPAGQQMVAYPQPIYQAGGSYKPYESHGAQSPSPQHAASEISSSIPQAGQELPNQRDGPLTRAAGEQ